MDSSAFSAAIDRAITTALLAAFLTGAVVATIGYHLILWLIHHVHIAIR